MDLAESRSADVGVDFGGLDAGVAQEFLNDAQVGAVFEQVGGEAVSKHVGRQRPLKAGLACALFDAAPECGRVEGGAAAGEKDRAGRAWADQPGASLLEVALEGGDRFTPHGDDPFLVALAYHGQEAAFQAELFQAQGTKFAEAQARGVGQLEDGLVAEGSRRFGLGRWLEEALDFLEGEGPGQSQPTSGQGEMFGQVARQVAFLDGVTVEGPQGRDGEVKRFTAERAMAWRFSGALGRSLLFLLQKPEQMGQGDLAPVLQFVTGGPFNESVQGVSVGFLGGFTLAAFVSQVDQEIFHQCLHGAEDTRAWRRLHL